MKYSVRIRERLKISFETHKNILEKLEAKMTSAILLQTIFDAKYSTN